MKEQIKKSYYKYRVRAIMKKLDGTVHSKNHIDKLIGDEPVIVKEIILELLNERNYFKG